MRIGKLFVSILISMLLISACSLRGVQNGAINGVPEKTLPSETAALPTSTLTPSPNPTQTLTPVPTIQPCVLEPGKTERMIFESALMGAAYHVSIYTPPCYGVNQNQQYPVLYLLHGQNMDDTYWLELGAGRIADELFSIGGKPFIMIFPEEVDDFIPILDSKFGLSVVTELVNWVEDNYQTCNERACRAIGGISRGGGWASRLGLRNFELFGAIGGHSPAILESDSWYVEQLLQTYSTDDFPRIYIDRGENDFLYKGIDYFESTLTTFRIKHDFHLNAGAHEQKYWLAHVREYIEWYMQGWE